jgi:hypothetical protein
MIGSEMIGSEKKVPVPSGHLPADDFSLCWFLLVTGNWQLIYES